MTPPAIAAAEPAARLARQLERYRSARTDPGRSDDPLPYRGRPARELADRLAAVVDGEVSETGLGLVVRVDRPSVTIELDRGRLADLPGQAPASRPLVCLDTETTGLATAAGTVAFLIGLGWWEGDRFCQRQLLLPDHPHEPALLAEVARHIPPDAWLVTYNGRGFDWPLLVTRYRLARRSAPAHDGHLDLLPIVRRVFRHRMDDARLQTVERMLLGSVRHGDVDGWEIPGRYLGFLRGGPAEPLAAVVRHNDEDVRSLARLLALIDTTLAEPVARRSAPRGDLAGLARAFQRERRFGDAIACLDDALAASEPVAAAEALAPSRADTTRVDEPWWSPRRPVDFGGLPQRRADGIVGPDRRQAFARPWDETRISVDRAHLLRRLGRTVEALEAWDALANGPGRVAVVSAIEAAKLREHRLVDVVGALASVERGLQLAERRRRLGLPEPRLEADLRHRRRRLGDRLTRAAARDPATGAQSSSSSAVRTGPAIASSVR